MNFTIVALALLAAPAFERPDILVWRVHNDTNGAVSSLLTEAIGKNPHVRVLSAEEMKNIVGFAADRAQIGAEPDGTMLGELAKRASADLVVFASVRGGAVDIGLFQASGATAIHRARVEKIDQKLLSEQANILVDKVLE